MTLDLLRDAWPMLLLAVFIGALLMWLWMRRRSPLPAPMVETAISNQAELKAHIEELEAEVVKQEEFIQRSKKDRSKLQQKLSQARKSRDTMRERLHAREEEVESLQGLLRRMEGERANLRRALEATKQPAKSAPVPPQVSAPTPKPEKPPSPQPDQQAQLSPAEARKAETLARVSARADEVNFERIGTATAGEKDDLKQIRGIGPFIEKKLNHLGIFTFRQIANFTPEDEEKVNEVIEFFPGRIRRDLWVAQSRERVSEEAHSEALAPQEETPEEVAPKDGEE